MGRIRILPKVFYHKASKCILNKGVIKKTISLSYEGIRSPEPNPDPVILKADPDPVILKANPDLVILKVDPDPVILKADSDPVIL